MRLQNPDVNLNQTHSKQRSDIASFIRPIYMLFDNSELFKNDLEPVKSLHALVAIPIR